MLYLRTGLPGASKTLNTIKEICTDPNLMNRSIYYHNIKLLFLDYEVCNSFSGWFYGVYLLGLNKSKKSKLDKIISEIHAQDALVTLDDFLYLEQLYEAWLTNNGPVMLWLKWVNISYSPKRLSNLKSYLDLNPDCSFEDLERFNLHWNNFAHPTLWYELPRQSIIVIDECQQWFPNRRVGSPVPKHCSEFETHRHKGWDIHLITQDAKLFDVHVRRLTNKHIHYFNPFTSNRVTRYESDKVFNPDDYHEKKATRSSIIKRDSSYYGLYWSADTHTHKFKLPKKLLLLPALLLIVVGGILFLLKGPLMPSGDVATTTASNSQPQPINVSSGDSVVYIPIELFSEHSHPLSLVCDSLSLSTKHYRRTRNSYSSGYGLECVRGDLVYVPASGDDLGYWSGDSSSFLLTSSYLRSLGYNFSSEGELFFLSYQDLTFILQNPFR